MRATVPALTVLLDPGALGTSSVRRMLEEAFSQVTLLVFFFSSPPPTPPLLLLLNKLSFFEQFYIYRVIGNSTEIFHILHTPLPLLFISYLGIVYTNIINKPILTRCY